MNNSTKTMLEYKYDVLISNVQHFSGDYQLSFDVMFDAYNQKQIIVKQGETISSKIEDFLKGVQK